MRNKKIKMELTHVENGFILGIVNSQFMSGDKERNYYTHTYVSNSIDDVPNLLLAHLVTERMNEQ